MIVTKVEEIERGATGGGPEKNGSGAGCMLSGGVVKVSALRDAIEPLPP